ncbi:MAG: hypothetical protein RJA36_1408 [Pseudomonadota bacterium]|jgi:hypothetical protein
MQQPSVDYAAIAANLAAVAAVAARAIRTTMPPPPAPALQPAKAKPAASAAPVVPPPEPRRKLREPRSTSRVKPGAPGTLSYQSKHAFDDWKPYVIKPYENELARQSRAYIASVLRVRRDPERMERAYKDWWWETFRGTRPMPERAPAEYEGYVKLHPDTGEVVGRSGAWGKAYGERHG